MSETLRPETPEQLAEVIRWAIASRTPLAVQGGGSKAVWGRPAAQGALALELAGIRGIVQYEPEELVLTARAGTPLAEIGAVLAERRQHLAFEPGDLGHLLQADPAQPATLGGVIACNLAGPRRVKAGAARDHVLGFHAVSGRGDAFKSGGRVVKNVTGFDLSKLIAGSFGTLAVMTELTVRALPAAEDTATVAVIGVEPAEAMAAMAAALASPNEVSGAAHLPASLARRSEVTTIAAPGAAATLLRIEGPAPSVAARRRRLTELLAGFGRVESLANHDSQALWREIGAVAYFAENDGRQLWRLSVPPSEGARAAELILDRLAGDVLYDWGGGLLWLALAPADDANEAVVRGTVKMTGGHATLVRADAAVRGRVEPFQPQPPALAALTRRIKDAFDPARVLNPGRMYADL